MSTTEPHAMSNTAIAGLHPASFAIVMATGIVSIAAQLRGFHTIALPLLWLNVVCYGVLWLLTLIRVARYRSQVVADLWDHNRSVGFFTTVAATCVLGNQFIIVESMPRVAIGLWFLGIALWAVSTYVIFTILTVKAVKPSVEDGLNGGWLVAVVAAQAVASLGGLVASQLGACREAALFFSLIMWLGGGMLYIWIISLIFYRYTFLPLDPRQLAPPYWINMGAMAISTLAGTLLVSNAPQSPLLSTLLPFLLGLTLLFWATATWWIPLLVALGVWRHLLCRVPLTYDVVYWSAVFPLGMYTVCTHRLSAVSELHWLDVVPKYFVFVALAAWGVTFLGLLRKLTRIV
jgi:tellurite resistance protein TehA-like permease